MSNACVEGMVEGPSKEDSAEPEATIARAFKGASSTHERLEETSMVLKEQPLEIPDEHNSRENYLHSIDLLM